MIGYKQSTVVQLCKTKAFLKAVSEYRGRKTEYKTIGTRANNYSKIDSISTDIREESVEQLLNISERQNL